MTFNVQVENTILNTYLLKCFIPGFYDPFFQVFQPTWCERDIYEGHPKVKAWMDRVRERLNPVWDEVIADYTELLKSVTTKN